MKLVARGGFGLYSTPTIFPIRLTAIAVAAVTAAIAIIWAVRYPERGLQDRIAGTWLVPR